MQRINFLLIYKYQLLGSEAQIFDVAEHAGLFNQLIHDFWGRDFEPPLFL